ncbi:MAG: amidohydrolase, partial [Puniceicoccaceae bacterium]
MIYRDCIALLGAELEPHRCASLTIENGIISELDVVEPMNRIDKGATVLIPGLVNGHTHMGDAAFPDGATGLTLEQGFFRPHGFKYQELAKLDRSAHLESLCDALGYMAATGTVAHIDFREQGPEGARRLREASQKTGVRSIILGQFDQVPFDDVRLEVNTESLPELARQELLELLEVADGFSESTMNDLTDPAWREIQKLTRSAGKARAIHCLENAGYRELSLARTGLGDLERAIELYGPDLIVHLTVADPEEIQRMAASGITAVLNPRANANLGLPLPPVAALLDAGVNLLLGTDNGLLNSPNLFAELDFTYKLAKSQYGDAVQPDPTAILKMVTSN